MNMSEHEFAPGGAYELIPLIHNAAIHGPHEAHRARTVRSVIRSFKIDRHEGSHGKIVVNKFV